MFNWEFSCVRHASPMQAPALGEAGHLLSLSRAELESFAEVYGQPKYRGKQMFDAMYKHGVRNLEEMTQVQRFVRIFVGVLIIFSECFGARPPTLPSTLPSVKNPVRIRPYLP